MPTFRLATLVPASAEDCFDLSLSVDAHVASMGRSDEQAVRRPAGGLLGPGDEVTWRARHFGLPFTMTSAITAFDRPVRFVDEQQRGPFAAWWHEHTFTAGDSGTTLMTDTIRYAAPLGPLGRLAERAVLDRYLPRLLAERNEWLRRELST
ncbi:hypothetical protein GCM10023258_11070 [Terrabacter aeriphilus]|uniref:Cyclase n=1 Tax=Terrabacter aeriphilus TaxID=515662 RepID=A0ABP9J7H9_9MICO